LTRYAFWIIAALVMALDQATKYLVRVLLPLNEPIPLLPGFLFLRHLHNPGVAFGQFAGGGPLLVLGVLAAVAGILLYRARVLRAHGQLHRSLTLGLGLALGGAVGNLIDRLWLGKVIDFIDLGWFPVFNAADSAITLGAVALVYYFLVVDRVPESTPRPVARLDEREAEPEA
jgi:signal peptidase II